VLKGGAALSLLAALTQGIDVGAMSEQKAAHTRIASRHGRGGHQIE
jgi:hypothetical protein